MRHSNTDIHIHSFLRFMPGGSQPGIPGKIKTQRQCCASFMSCGPGSVPGMVKQIPLQEQQSSFLSHYCPTSSSRVMICSSYSSFYELPCIFIHPGQSFQLPPRKRSKESCCRQQSGRIRSKHGMVIVVTAAGPYPEQRAWRELQIPAEILSNH